MPIASPIGFLDVVNATLRASQVESTSRLTVANTAATKNFSVGDKFHIDKDSVDPVSVTGNVVATGIKISNLTISPTFDLGAVSNVGNTTANTLQFANATTGFTTTANVEIGGNITLTSNAQVMVGSNVLMEYTGPHPREPKEVPIKKYPEIAFDDLKMDRNDTTNTYTQAGYTVTADSQITECKAYKAFDNKFFIDGADLNRWQTGNHGYYGSTADTTTGPVTTLADSTTKRGSYIQLESPHKIIVSRYVIWVQENANTFRPKKVILLGSNTGGTDWVSIDPAGEVEPEFVSTGAGPTISTMATVSFTNTTAYKYHRLVVRANNGGTVVLVQELELYGRDEPSETSGDLSLDTTLKSTFNSVRSNNYVMYFDGEDPTGDPVVPKYLPSGTVKTITPNNITFDATNNCWSLDGSTESNVTTADLGFEGDAPHTVSMWVNASNLEANATTQQLFSIGSGYDKALVRVDDTQIAANTWHNVTYTYQGKGGSKVTYVDGRKVEEAQVEDTFGKYPPFAMTAHETGGFRVSASNEDGSDSYFAWEVFDNGTGSGSSVGWFSNQLGNYNGTNGTVTTTSTVRLAPETEKGEWLQLEFPYFFHLSSFTIFSQSDSQTTHTVDNLIVYAKKGLSDTWTSLGTFTGIAARQSASGVSEAVNANEMYKYFAIVVTKRHAQHSTDGVTIRELKYYGHKEGDLTRFPDPTNVLKYPRRAITSGHIAGDNKYINRFDEVSTTSEYSTNGGTYSLVKAFDNIDDASITYWSASKKNSPSGNLGRYASGAHGAYNEANGDPPTGKSFIPSNATTAQKGEWIKMKSYHKLKLNKIELLALSTTHKLVPSGVLVWGSNDDSNWTLLKTHVPSGTGGAVTYSSRLGVITVNSTVAYKYHAMVMTHMNDSDSTYTLMSISQMRFYGTEEDTGTPAIVGGPFAGKVANFRVYDKYLGEERIQEIYDAQKDAFGHKKSSMTLYKGRIGVGTTEPEGALTVLDEPHALAKFPERAVTADDSYVEGDGQIKISAAEGLGYRAFDSLTSTSWDASPEKHTRLSEEVDFGAWLKIQTPESISLKKAEIESNPYWRQVGPEIAGDSTSDQFGVTVACNHDGTRIMATAPKVNSSAGRVRVYDWTGSTWVQVGQNLTGANETGARFGHALAMSGDGNIIAIGAPFEHSNGGDAGTVRVYYLVGSTWTILPDSGALTGVNAPYVDTFVGPATNDQLGQAVKLSYDGKTLAFNVTNEDEGGTDRGQVRILKYVNGAWTNKGSAINGTIDSQQSGLVIDMSDDGDHIIIGGNDSYPNVRVYKWDASGNSWGLKGSAFTHPSPNDDGFGQAVAISNDGNVVAIGIRNADVSDGAREDNTGIVRLYHWSNSAWTLKDTLVYPHLYTYDDDDFGTTVNLSGDGKRLIVSAPWYDNSGDDNPGTAGKLWVYEYNNKNWVLRQPSPTASAPTTDGYQSAAGTESGGIGLVGNQDSVLGSGIENDRWTDLGLPDMGGQSIAISRDGSAIVAGEWAYNSSSAGGDRGRIRVWNMPSNIKSIWGSNDNKNWTKITTAPTREEATSNVAGFQFGYNDFIDIKNIDNPNYYKYHAIVADAFTRLKDVKLFGVRKQGSSTLHDGALTLTKNLDVHRIGPAFDADDTPRRDRLVVEYNTSTNPMEDGIVKDTSGRGIDGVLGSVSYDATGKSFKTFSSGGIKTSATNNLLESNGKHSFSAWIRFDSPGAWEGVYGIGANIAFSGNNDVSVVVGNNKFRIETRSSGPYWSDRTYTFVPGKWVHMVVVYNGGGGLNGFDIYMDTVKLAQSGSTNGTAALNLPTTNLSVHFGQGSENSPTAGPTYVLDGGMSSIKFYDTALTFEEIKALYNMGRCDEGHHTVNFSKTRVGIGLGDGEAPQAALDVRGPVSLGSPFGGSTVGIGTNLQKSYPKDVPLHVFRWGANADENGGGILLERYPGYGGSIWSQYNGSKDTLMFRCRGNEVGTYGGTPQMVLDHDGNVGIGSSTPYAKLHVVGATGTLSSGVHYGFASSLSARSFGTGVHGSVSIYGNDDIVAGGYVLSHAGTMGSSDERIKKEIVDVEDGEALSTLRLLKPKRYKYRDEVKRGIEPVWGFIAQEVRDTLPYATQKRRECIPNIYELANVTASNVINFTNFNTTNLESNTTSQIKLFDVENNEHLVKLVSVLDEHSIQVDNDLSAWMGAVDETGNVVSGNQIFVYGEEVDDFVFLRKDAIWTVATAALQEIDRQLQAEKAKVATLETQVADLLARVQTLESA